MCGQLSLPKPRVRFSRFEVALLPAGQKHTRTETQPHTHTHTLMILRAELKAVATRRPILPFQERK